VICNYFTADTQDEVMKASLAFSMTLTLIASTVLSQEPKKQDTTQAQRKQQAVFEQLFRLRGLELTTDQQVRAEELQEKYELFEECSPITHLREDDPPAQLIDGMSMEVADIHSPRFGKALKDKMDPLGIRCEVYAGQDVLGGGERISTIDFIKEAFGME
jgi:hypothetical protein